MVKYVNDYVEELCKMYPNILKSDIIKIVNYGFRLMFRLVRRGLDVLLQNDNLWFYIGELTNDGTKHYHYYKRKLFEKIRYIFEAKGKWDLNYYVAIPDEMVTSLTKKRPKTSVKLDNMILFKSLDAAKVYYDLYKYFIQVPAITDLGFLYKAKSTLKNVKLIYTRDTALTLNDLIISSKNYSIL